MLPVTGAVGFGVFSLEGRPPRVGFRVGKRRPRPRGHGFGSEFATSEPEPVPRARPIRVGGRRRPSHRARARRGRARAARARDRPLPVRGRRLRRLLLVARARDEPRAALPAWTPSRCYPTGGTSRSATTAARGRSSSAGLRSCDPAGRSKAPDDPAPRFGPSGRLDFELELGFVVGVGSTLGEPVPASAFRDHVFGVVS